MTTSVQSVSDDTPATVTFRSFETSPATYQTAIDIHRAVWADSDWNVQSAKHGDKTRNPKYHWQRHFVEKDGKPVGLGMHCETWWSQVPDQYYINLAILPEYEGLGLGTAYFDFVMQRLRARNAQVIEASTREDKPQAIRYLEKRGFERFARYPRSKLAVDTFDFGRYDGLRDKLAAEGVVVAPLSQLQAQFPDWQRRLWELEWVLEQDEPTPEPPQRSPFEEYAKMFTHHQFTPESWFIAVDGDAFVGMSILWPDDNNPRKLNTGWTGVERTHRQRGVATAMKVVGIDYARRQGVAEIHTDNHEDNVMYQINLKMGYRPLPAYIGYKKQVA